MSTFPEVMLNTDESVSYHENIKLNKEDVLIHIQWILAKEFRYNISSHFKIWILFTNPHRYGPSKEQAISCIDLKKFKIQHNYAELKNNESAPWHQYLFVLETQIARHTLKDSSTLDSSDNSNYEEVVEKLKKVTMKYRDLVCAHAACTAIYLEKSDTKQKQFDLQNQYINKLHTNITTLKNTITKHTELIIRYQNELHYAGETMYEIYEVIRQKDLYIEKIDKEIKQWNDGIEEGIQLSSISDDEFNIIEKLAEQYESPPDNMLCPITRSIMIDPVIAFDGHSYERSAIEQWLKMNHKSPISGSELKSRMVLPNHTLRKHIVEFLSGNN
tara:strand:- start:7 stop:996 length:990 start_codon:yes stop_codon:yes gene_type:complete